MANSLLKFFLLIFSSIFLLVGCGDIEGDVSITISPNSPTIGVSQSQLFTAVGKDSAGNLVQISPVWGVTGGIGAISSSGIFIAGTSTGQGYVIATYGTSSDSSLVTITDTGWLIGRAQGDLGYAAGIRVYVSGNSSLNDLTDTDGRYEISGIPAGTYEILTEETVLYEEASNEVIIDSGETVTWNIILETQPGAPTVPTTTPTTLF
jgi:hypothetical protein